MLNFLLYFSLVIVLWAAAIAVYVRITPYPEFQLARDGNLAATISLVGTALGLAFPLASLAAHAVDLMDLAMWAGVALAIQLLCWVVLARLVFPWMKAAIAANQTPAGLLLGGFSAGIGLLNAACLTY
jgi:putative membrane protein